MPLPTLPPEWLALKQAWHVGHGVEEALDRIHWDFPALAREEDEAGNTVFRLVHPLSALVLLGEPALTDAVADRVLAYSWPSQEAGLSIPPSVHTEGSPHLYVHPLDSLWNWGVLDDAVAAGAWSFAAKVLPMVSQGSRKEKYSSLANAHLCGKLAQITQVEHFMGLWDELSRQHKAAGLDVYGLAGAMFTQLAKAGNSRVAEHFIERVDEGYVDVAALVLLANAGFLDVALRAARLAQDRECMGGHKSHENLWIHALRPALMANNKHAAAHVAWMAGSKPAATRALTHPTALVDHDVTCWPQIARALLVDPPAFDSLLESGDGPSQAVLMEWARRTTPSDPAISAWLRKYRQSVSPAIAEQALGAIIKNQDETPPLNIQGEKIDHLATVLLQWSEGLGVDASHAEASIIPNSELRFGSGFQVASAEWVAALARARTQRLESIYPPASPSSRLRF